MTKENLYTYLGANGIITSPIRLEGIQSVKKYRLIAADNKKLTKDNESYFQTVIIPADELELWEEV